MNQIISSLDSNSTNSFLGRIKEQMEHNFEIEQVKWVKASEVEKFHFAAMNL